ncbi:MAG: DUF6529 family protein [Actinomycetota bacterium]|nr:DUF6529 family protein [Actinomycetota bacterium]
MDDWVEELARGNVSQVKTALATIVVVLAFYQVFLMAVGYGKLNLPFLKGKAASFAHRSIGDSILLITVLIALMCIGYFEVGDGIEHARGEETTRATVHVVAAFALLGVLGLKVVVIRWWHSMGRFLPHLGITVFTLFLVTWITSAGNYLWGSG